MKRYIDRDIWAGGFLTLLAAYVLITASSFKGESKVFPLFVAALLLVASVVVVYGGVKKTQKIRGSADPELEQTMKEDAAERQMALVSFLFCVGYVLLIVPLGFFLSTTVFLVTYMLYLGVRKWKTIVAVALCTDIVLYFLFVSQMRVMLPKGILI